PLHHEESRLAHPARLRGIRSRALTFLPALARLDEDHCIERPGSSTERARGRPWVPTQRTWPALPRRNRPRSSCRSVGPPHTGWSEVDHEVSVALLRVDVLPAADRVLYASDGHGSDVVGIAHAGALACVAPQIASVGRRFARASLPHRRLLFLLSAASMSPIPSGP